MAAMTATSKEIENLKKRVSDLEKNVFATKLVEIPRGMDGFTDAGGITVLSNSFVRVSDMILKSTLTLNGFTQRQHAARKSFEINGDVHAVTVLLQSILDSTARLCLKVGDEESENTVNVYFHNASFRQSDIAWVAKHQTEISNLRFRNKSFNDIANYIKHEQPWLGTVSCSVDCINDIYDDDGIGFVYGMLIPVYHSVSALLTRLARQQNVPVPSFPRA